MIVFKKISQLIEHPHNVEIYGQTHVSDEFVNGVKREGILQPILISSRLLKGKHPIVSGNRRTKAATFAGLDEVPCIVTEYADEDAEIAALIEANIHNRDKTEAQKNRERDEAERLVLKMKSEGKLPGRTNELVAEMTGTTVDEAKFRKAVHNDDYRKSFFDKMKEKGVKDAVLKEAEVRWDSLRDLQLKGSAITTIYKGVMDIQKQVEAKIPAPKVPKGEKAQIPELKQAVKEKERVVTPFADGIFELEISIKDQVLGMGQDFSFGLAEMPNGSQWPFIAIDSKHYAISWDKLRSLL